MKILVSVLFLGLIAFSAAAREEPPAPSVEDLVAEGVDLHDQGEFEKAIQKYKRALEIEPDHVEAVYELANTYLATRQYDLCAETARQGLAKPGSKGKGEIEPLFYSLLASCLSSSGKTRKALRIFEQGLAKYPDDRSLNFNIAVTLGNQGEPRRAIPHLQKAIEAEPSYSSPYFVLGKIYANETPSVLGIFFFMRFVSLEPDSERTTYASARIFQLLTAGVSTEGEEKITVSLSPDFDKTDFGFLDFGRTLAVTEIYREEAKTQSKAQRFVSALDTFVKIAEELASGGKGGKATSTFAWKRAVLPIFELQKRGALECFGYTLAAQADFEGAKEWLKNNPEKTRELEAALAELNR